MSRSVKVLVIQPDPLGPAFGRILRPEDFELWQQYAHEHVEGVTRYFLMAGSASERVAGFDYALAGGLSLSVAAGQAVTTTGITHDTLPPGEAHVLVLDPADPALPRIDLVYAHLEVVDAEVDLTPHRQLRTTLEQEQGVPQYPPTNLNVANEQHKRASILVKKGAPNAVPVAPAAGPNEAPLYQVRVNAGVANLIAGNVTDVRNKVRSLHNAWVQIDANLAMLAALNESIDDRVAALVVNSASVNRVYDDAAGTLTFNVEAEFIQDTVAAFIAAGLGITVAYNDVANTFTVSASAEFIQDTVDGFLVAGAGITKTYDDNANTLTLAVTTEHVQDLVAALLQVTAGTGLSLVYDDAAGTLTLTGVDSSGAGKGMMSAAHFSLVNGATDAATGNTLFKRDASGDGHLRRLTLTETSGGAKVTQLVLSNPGSGTSTGSRIDFRMTNQVLARIEQDFDFQPANIDEGLLRFYLSKSATFTPTEIFRIDYNSPHTTVFGDSHTTGAVSAGSKPFVIDHPLPELARERNLRYVAVESPRADVLIRGRAKLSKGRAVVDLDAEARQTGGTFVALARDVQAFAWNESKGAARWEQIAWEVKGASLVIESRDPAATLDVGFVVFGERQDAFIRHSGMTDADGRWITEYPKQEVGAEKLARATAEREEVIETDDEPRPEGEAEEVVADLLGKRGHLLHPDAFGVKPQMRKVRVKERRREGRAEGGAGGKGGKKNN